MPRRFAHVFLLSTWAFSISLASAGPAENAHDNLQWHDVRGLAIEGKGWTDTKAFYDRLPAKADGMVRAPVWGLSHHSAGICARFTTDSQQIYARWVLTDKNMAMSHMPATGVSGLDLYAKVDGGWHWVGVGRPDQSPKNTARIGTNLLPGQREYLLYLPLYNGVASVEIGIERGRTLAKADPRPATHARPIVFYGTSITQGGCASRPGMVHTAILGRRFDRPVINLGFSGNGRTEPEMATLLAELDPATYVIESMPNTPVTEIRQRVEVFVRTLRAAHARTPILLVEDRTCPDAYMRTDRIKGHRAKRAALKQAYDNLLSGGVTGLYYLEGDKLLTGDDESTVDGSHPTDLGFVRQADALEIALRPLLVAEERR